MGRKKVSWLLAVVFILPVMVLADVTFLRPFQRMLILENGRQKPIDTFARNQLKQFSGRSTFSGQDASSWLARVLFTPGQTLDDKIFLLNHPDVPAALGIAGQGRQRYSFLQLRPGLDRLQQLALQTEQLGEQSRSAVENEIMRLAVNVHVYVQLLNAFDFSSDPEAVSRGAEADASPLLAIIPLAGAPMGKWQSPGAILAEPSRGRSGAEAEIALLAKAARAFASGSEKEFSDAISAFNHAVQKKLGHDAAGKKISLEIFYNRLDPFFKAGLAYGLALVFLLLALLMRGKTIRSLSLLFLLSGLMLHSCGLLARMLIMNRPPVTNLYETFVFVAWTSVLLGILLEWFQKKSPGVHDRPLGGLADHGRPLGGLADHGRPLEGLGVMAGSIAGLVFLVIAGRYSMEGDTMGMLAAVLDSNLWLATHVVTISVGYAGCVIAGIIGHVYVVHQLLFPSDLPFRQRTARSLYAVLAFGLVFTFIGTVMGGIWADQSWGRFWGWDPKENGALLIILWCAILFHARLAGLIGQLGMAIGAIGSIITVVLAWFGVNLLGVGMHSYGFTSGIARWLLFFIAGEVIFISTALLLIRKKQVSKNAGRGAK